MATDLERTPASRVDRDSSVGDLFPNEIRSVCHLSVIDHWSTHESELSVSSGSFINKPNYYLVLVNLKHHQ